MRAAEPPPLSLSVPAVLGSDVPVRTGVVGQGRWGTRLTDALRRSARFRVEALCDARRECLPEDATLKLTERSGDLFALGLEAVVIATNPQFHAELAVAALESGHHVLIEKPCALSAHDAERICRVAERTQRIVGVGHLLRYHAAYERLVELGRSGALGELLGAVAERLGSRPRPDVDSWWMLGPHDFSVLYALFDGAADDVQRLEVAEDAFVAAARFGSRGASLWVRSGGVSSRRFAVVGAHTTALLDDLNEPGTVRLVSTAAPGLVDLVASCVESSKGRAPGAEALERALSLAFGEPAELLHIPVPPPLERELEAFAAAIRDGAALGTGAREGLAVIGMLEAGQRGQRGFAEGTASARAREHVVEQGP